MLRFVADAALRLDQWLQARLGRPYRVILSIGLTIEIIRRLTGLPAEAREARSLIGAAMLILLNLALLVNQLGEMSHRLAKRSAETGGRGPRRGEEPPP